MFRSGIKQHGLTTAGLHGLILFLFAVPAAAGITFALVSYFRPSPPPAFGLIKPAFQMSAVDDAAAEIENINFETLMRRPFNAPPHPFDQAFEERFATSQVSIDLVKSWRQAGLALFNLAPVKLETFYPPEFGLPLVPFKAEAPAAENIAINAPLIGASTPAMTANAPTIDGKVEIIDAGTLSVGGRAVHLAGIALPDEGKMCVLLSGETTDCRHAAADQLTLFLRWRSVSCSLDTALSDQAIGHCRLGDTDISEWLVRRGWATPDGGSDNKLASAVLFAHNYRLGQWRPTNSVNTVGN